VASVVTIPNEFAELLQDERVYVSASGTPEMQASKYLSPRLTKVKDGDANIGSLAVIATYLYVFSQEDESYLISRFWVGIPRQTATALVPLQAAAAVGYIVFLGQAVHAESGLLTYLEGRALAALVATFSAASVAWPLATRWYLDGQPTVARAMAPATSLVLAALAAIGMTAGAFEADLHWSGVIGSLIFANVVVLTAVVTMDFASLYPSIMRSQNLCWNSWVAPRTTLPSWVTTTTHHLAEGRDATVA